MAIATAINTTTDTNMSSGISINCYVTLSDTEQMIISVEEKEGSWSNGNYVIAKTGVINKYRLEQLIYHTGFGDTRQGFNLESVKVRGFRKDGGIKFRDTCLYGLDKEVIDQIPDHYHNYAREAFAKEVVEMQTELTNIINKGVVIEPRH